MAWLSFGGEIVNQTFSPPTNSQQQQTIGRNPRYNLFLLDPIIICITFAIQNKSSPMFFLRWKILCHHDPIGWSMIGRLEKIFSWWNFLISDLVLGNFLKWTSAPLLSPFFPKFGNFCGSSSLFYTNRKFGVCQLKPNNECKGQSHPKIVTNLWANWGKYFAKYGNRLA